jgi:sprT-like family
LTSPHPQLWGNQGRSENLTTRKGSQFASVNLKGDITTMKSTVKSSRTMGYLEKIFRALNAKYFDGTLEEPIITIMSTPRAYGHVTVSKTWRRGDEYRHELNIGAGTLDRPIENIVATMIHEMVHLHNMQIGVKDCSRNGVYHNKKFRDAATARDLAISYDPRLGWSITQPTDKLCEFILEQGWSDIEMGRAEYISWASAPGATNKGPAPDPGTTGKRPSSTRKYICPCCGMSVRATKIVRVMCMDCEEQLVLAE